MNQTRNWSFLWRATVLWPAIVVVLAGCGASSSPQGDTTTGATEEEVPELDIAQVDPSEVPVPLPEMGPSEETPPELEGSPPAIGDVDSATEALAAGWYGAVLSFARSPEGARLGAAAELLIARAQLATGEYEGAATSARAITSDATVGGDARVVLAEALLARGDRSAAETELRAAAAGDDAWRAKALLGRLLLDTGRSSEAQRPLYDLIGAYNDGGISEHDGEGLAYVAYAAWGLGSFRDANDAFIESTRAYERSEAVTPERVEAQIEWAALFMEKYDTGHAEESLRAALALAPGNARAHALMAKLKIEQSFDFSAASAYAERALAINPNLIDAHLVHFGIALRDLDFDSAEEHLGRAAAIDDEDLDLMSHRAAMAYLQEDEAGFEAAKREILAIHPRYSRMYRVIAEYADWEHRYPEIVEMSREALTLNPSDAYAQATLGLNLLRMGEEEPGLEALRAAWRRDRYNVQVYNTLNLYDEIIANEYIEHPAEPFTFRFHRAENELLERYVPPTLVGAYRGMTQRYRFTPEGPLRIELFNNLEHFSVRTTGLPNLGVQGVCFGKVVTAISPGGGPFNWGQITWHELAHVFHIQLSRNRVPRWFTEGLAEYETIVARPEWQREEDHRLFGALQAGSLPPLRLMNRAFTHARSADDMMTAYYASSQIVVYLVDRFGFAKVPELLRAWGRGLPTEEVISSVLGVSIDELDQGFRAHTLQRLSGRGNYFQVDFGAYRDVDSLRQAAEASPSDAAAQAALAAGLAAAGEMQEAKATAERAIGLEAGQPLARFLLARMALGGGDAAAAEEHLRAILSGGRDGYELRLMLARTAMAREDAAQTRIELEAATAVDPSRAEAWQGLLSIAEQGDDGGLRRRALEHLADLDQHSAPIWRSLMQLLEEEQEWDALVARGESMLYLAPLDAESHRLLGVAYLRTDQARKALFELDSALLAEPDNPGPVHLARARALHAVGRRSAAREAAQAAVEADPELQGAAADLL